jgi:hypothetical protein
VIAVSMLANFALGSGIGAMSVRGRERAVRALLVAGVSLNLAALA